MVRAILFPQGRRSRSKRNNSPVVDFVVVDSDAATFNVVVLNDGSLGEFGVIVFAVAVLEVVGEKVLRVRRRKSVAVVAVVDAQNVVERRNVRRRNFRFSARCS